MTASVGVFDVAVTIATADAAIATKVTDSTAKFDRLTVRFHHQPLVIPPTQS